MKRSHILGCVLLCPACEQTQPDPITIADSVAAVIDTESASLRRDTATAFGLSAEGALLEGLYAGDELRRLRGTFLGESGRVTESYYFGPKLFLVVQETATYDAPLSGRVARSEIVRYYLEGGVVIGTVPASLGRAAVSDFGSESVSLRALLDSLVRERSAVERG